MRRRLIELTTEHVTRRVLVYAGIGDDCLDKSVAAAAESILQGVEAVVAHLPCYFTLQPEEMLSYYLHLMERIEGPLIIYSIPSTTHMSIPVEVIAQLCEHPRIAGFKDSENSPGRPEELVRQLGSRKDFSLLIGVSVLSDKALSLGMDGVVPSSANLEPRPWRELLGSAQCGDWEAAERVQNRVDGLTRVFQRDRTLGQSIAALKAATSRNGLCGPAMLPPLRALRPEESARILRELSELGWLDAQPHLDKSFPRDEPAQ
jgi:4-hydroxy-tetrahydrodipicolinate synthase